MDVNQSFFAFRLLGIDVRFHWSLPVAAVLYFVVRAFQYSFSPLFLALFVVLPMITLLVSVIAHEYGHALTARALKLPVGHMVLTPIGGMVMVAQGRGPREELRVAAAGPLVNLALGLALAVVYLALGGPLGVDLLIPFWPGKLFAQLWGSDRIGLLVLLDVIHVQMTLFLFNVLVAAYPMDGGRILMSILWKRRGFRPALVQSCKIAQVIAGLMAVTAVLTGELMLLVIAFFVFMQASRTIQIAPQLAEPGSWGYAPPSSSGRSGGARPSSEGWSPTEWLRKLKLRRRWKKIERELKVLEGGAGKDLDPPTPPKKKTDWN